LRWQSRLSSGGRAADL